MSIQDFFQMQNCGMSVQSCDADFLSSPFYGQRVYYEVRRQRGAASVQLRTGTANGAPRNRNGNSDSRAATAVLHSGTDQDGKLRPPSGESELAQHVVDVCVDVEKVAMTTRCDQGNVSRI